LFTGFWYQAATWPQPRWVVAKAEANDRGTNRRFVVTNRPGAALFPGPTYDEYAARGEATPRWRWGLCVAPQSVATPLERVRQSKPYSATRSRIAWAIVWGLGTTAASSGGLYGVGV